MNARGKPSAASARVTALVRMGAVIAAFLTVVPASGQWLKYPSAIPRLSDGKPDLSAPAPRGVDGRPDLSGIWTRSALAPGWDLKALRESGVFTDQNLTYHMPPGASIPFQPWAEALFRERQARNGAGAPSEHCMPTGIPEATLEPPPFKIAQMNGLTIILFESFNRYRQIHTDGRPAPVDPNPSWWGYSIGKWESDTFVVDTTGFNDLTWLDKAGHPHSDALHTTERFRRLDVGRMELQVTIDDPKAYTRAWTATIPFRLLPDTELLEDACENERDAKRIESIASHEKGK
jgi:hypothetical protein